MALSLSPAAGVSPVSVALQASIRDSDDSGEPLGETLAGLGGQE